MHASEDGDPLRSSASAVEVVVIGDAGDPEAWGVVLRRGVGAITVARVVREAGVALVGEFCCVFILALDAAHSLGSEEATHGKLGMSRKGVGGGGGVGGFEHSCQRQLGNYDSMFHYFSGFLGGSELVVGTIFQLG